MFFFFFFICVLLLSVARRLSALRLFSPSIPPLFCALYFSSSLYVFPATDFFSGYDLRSHSKYLNTITSLLPLISKQHSPSYPFFGVCESPHQCLVPMRVPSLVLPFSQLRPSSSCGRFLGFENVNSDVKVL